MTDHLQPFTPAELSMDMGSDGTFPFTEGESAEITGYGHQDKAEFAAAVNRYDELTTGEPYPEGEQWTADDIGHDWVVRITPELCGPYTPGDDKAWGQRVTPDTPGAFPVTTLWGAR